MGPLKGVRILEIGGIGPGPFCGMMLSDMGANVVRIERKGGLKLTDRKFDILLRNRRSVVIDLRQQQGVAAALEMVVQVDALFEGFRPGVMERLGLGPDVCLACNPKLVYGRMTGWGQKGPLAKAAGHDINYVALSGALHAIGGQDGKPVPPLNLVGDFGGGGMMLAFGMVCALLEAHKTGQGQVVDAAMVDGAAALMAMIYGFKAAGAWADRRGANLIDGGAHYYDTYETADGKYISIAAMEPQFYALMLELLGIDDPEFKHQNDRKKWPELKKKLAAVFATQTRDHWCEILEGTDVCFAPVLSLEEAPLHRHNRARNIFVEIDGVTQPAPVPRLSRSTPEIKHRPPEPGDHTRDVLSEFGFTSAEIEALHAAGVITVG